MRHIWVGCILLSTAVGGQAATLGRHSGAAVIGRPLDVRVQALLGPDEDLNALCVQSDVFYGDTQVSPGAVRTVAQKSAPDAEASLRIRASVPIDEPVVTLYVRAGCNAPFSRRYVLLADPVSEPQSAAAPAVGGSSALPARALPSANALSAPTAGGAAVAAPSGGQAPAASSGAGVTEPAPARPAKPAVAPAVKDKPAGVKPPKQAKPTSLVRKPPAPAMPRLELDPVDVELTLDRDPVLKMSLSMLSEPTASDAERAAAARLWKAINASPEDILRDNQKLEGLEAEAKGLREQEARSKATLEAMESQLEQSRYMSWLVYALGASLLAAVLALAYLWRKRGSAASGDDSAVRAWGAAAEADAARGPVPGLQPV